MLIYRIQDKSNNGPYCDTLNSLGKVGVRGLLRHPPPICDLQLRLNLADLLLDCCNIPSDLIFGFSSIKQARRWVYRYSWCESLRKHGYELYSFELQDDEIIQGDNQVVFKRESMIKANQTKLDLMEELWRKRKS